MRKNSYQKITAIFIALFLLITTGTTGYMILEGIPFLDALYMTIITISTVGYREVADLSVPGKLFTMAIILAGLGTVAYAFTSIFSFLLEGEFKNILRRRKMDNKVSQLKEHYILCGAGQTGKCVIERFLHAGVDFVVIEKNRDKVEELIEREIIAFHGDATQEEFLEKAKIKQAKGLISCLAVDTDNVFTVLTARGMNPNLYIVSRSIEENAHSKLLKAGADKTISPNELGGNRMAYLLLKPAVVSFLDIITVADDVTLELEEVMLCEDSELLGETLGDALIQEKTGVIFLAIKKKDEEKLRLNPGPQEKLEREDKMLVLGTGEQVNILRKIACEPGA